MNDGLLLRNPLRGLSLPLGKPRRAVQENEFQTMLRWSPAFFRRVLVFLRATGARPCEARLLRWEWVDLARGVITIPPDQHKSGYKTGRPKVIVLIDPVRKMLAWMQRRAEPGQAHVFLSSHRRPWTRVGFAKRLITIRQRSGLPADCTLHGIRHAFGTNGVTQGGSLKLVSALLGHASARVTESFYCHLDDGALEALRKTAAVAGRRTR